MIIDGSVYDVSKFIVQHPGGAHALLTTGGGDASEDFHGTGHSKVAKDLLESMYIGSFEGSTKRAGAPAARKLVKPLQGGLMYKLFHMFLPLFLILGAIFVKVVGDRYPELVTGKRA